MSKQEETKLDENELNIIAGLLFVSYDKFPEEERPSIGLIIKKLKTMTKELKNE